MLDRLRPAFARLFGRTPAPIVAVMRLQGPIGIGGRRGLSMERLAGPLERMTRTRDEGFGWHRDGSDFEHAHATTVMVEYGCRRCRAWYSLTELTARHRR